MLSKFEKSTILLNEAPAVWEKGFEKELKEIEEDKERNEKKLKVFLLPKDKDDEKKLPRLKKTEKILPIADLVNMKGFKRN